VVFLKERYYFKKYLKKISIILFPDAPLPFFPPASITAAAALIVSNADVA